MTNLESKQINAKLNTVMQQSVANAHGIAQINSNLEQYHDETKSRLMDIENQLKASRDDTGRIINEQASASITRNNFDTEAKEERHQMSFTMKLALGTELVLALLMILACFILIKFVVVPSQENETKDSIISWYESVIDEYGLELPEFPEFPEVSITGGGN